MAGINKIYVGSESDEYLSLADKLGAIPILRNEDACDESISSANQMIADFSAKIEGDVVALWAHCTNPFLYSNFYVDAIVRYFEASSSGDYDSLISVYKIQSHMWDCKQRPCNYDPYLPRHTLAKELPPVYFQDGGIFIQDLKSMKINSYFFGANPYLFEIDPIYSLDINTQHDLDVANLLSASLDAKFNFN
jgi:CMP-N-acetylneuraminic acid synthetase